MSIFIAVRRWTMLTFISYSHKDMDFASKLREDLERSNIPVWRDEEDIPFGAFWDDKVTQALRSGGVTHLLVICSESSANSRNVLNEIALADDCNIEPIIPLVIDDCLRPIALFRRKYVDFRPSYESGFQTLLSSVVTQPVPSTLRTVKSETYSLPITKLRPPQEKAAHDLRSQVRLVAGPGTGKSFVIEERVRFLLESSVHPNTICVVSFTRASSHDLRLRIIEYCKQHHQPGAENVSVTTLHSLALQLLRKAKLLTHYPVNPEVLDWWELQNVFDLEFKEGLEELGIKTTPSRCEDIRRAYEALWCSGEWEPPNYIKPDPPISDAERNAFDAFLIPTTQVYSCVLPGEIISKCVQRIDAGLLDPA